VNALPAVLCLDYREGPSAEWIRKTFSYAADEIAAGRMGSETVFAKLSELLFVEAIRRYAESLPEGHTGWLAGLRDPSRNTNVAGCAGGSRLCVRELAEIGYRA